MASGQVDAAEGGRKKRTEMSISYTAGVFFGAAVPHRSSIGAILDDYIDRHGGTPAASGVEGVEISVVGSDANEWITVQATGSVHTYGRNEGDCPAPLLLVAPPMWRTEIGRFLDTIDDPAARTLQVGWHFQGSVR